MTREDEIRQRLDGDEAGISVHMVAFDREVRADLRFLLEKAERLEAAIRTHRERYLDPDAKDWADSDRDLWALIEPAPELTGSE